MNPCSRCGSENTETAKFCRNCGNPLTSAPPVRQNAAQRQSEQPVVQPVLPLVPPPVVYAQLIPPEHSQPAATVSTPKKRSSCGCCLLVMLGLLLAVAVIIVGGYLLFRNGTITQDMVMTLIGQGPAAIEVDNFRDDAMTVNVKAIQASEDSGAVGGQLILNPYDVKHFIAAKPGRYEFTFISSEGSENLGSCTLTVRSGDQYQFVSLPDQIAVNRVNDPSNSGRDFVIETSSLCR